MHTVKIKNTKANRKALKGWDLKAFYPVITMEIEDVHVQQQQASASRDTPISMVSGEITIDDDDEDEEGAYEEPNPQTVTLKRIWLLVGSKKTGKYAWLTTEDVKYVSF